MFVFEGAKPIADIPKYTHVADVLLATLSKADLLGLTIPAKIMSYIAAGKPILAAMNDEPNKLINSIGCGICVSAEDSNGLFNAFNTIYKMSSKQRLDMGQKAKTYHFAYFERNSNLQKLINFMFG